MSGSWNLYKYTQGGKHKQRQQHLPVYRHVL